MKTIKSILVFILVVALVCGGFWLSGYNFNCRGAEALGCALMSSVLGIIAVLVYLGTSYEGEK